MKALVKWLPLLIIVSAAVFAAGRAQDIRDWWTLRSYDAPAEIIELAKASRFSEAGERAFYVSQPELNKRQAFNANCPFLERNLVLGCYADQRIYIFAVDDKRLDGVEEITAAHEMLHAVYDRLSTSETEYVDRLVRQAADQIDDKSLRETLETYEVDDPNSVPNELHSLLGTEYADLPAELEAHYAKYFEDRSVILGISARYEKVFDKIQNNIERLDEEIKELRNDIEAREVNLQVTSEFLNSEAKRLDSLLDANRTAEYNAAVPPYNATVNSFNASIDLYQTRVEEFNALVKNRNSIALEQNSLVQSLNSKFSPIDNAN